MFSRIRNVILLLVLLATSSSDMAANDPLREMQVKVGPFERPRTSLLEVFNFLATDARVPVVFEADEEVWIDETPGILGPELPWAPEFPVSLPDEETTAADVLKAALANDTAYTARPMNGFIHIIPKAGNPMLDVQIEFGTEYVDGRPPCVEDALSQFEDACLLNWAQTAERALATAHVPEDVGEKLSPFKRPISKLSQIIREKDKQRVYELTKELYKEEAGGPMADIVNERGPATELHDLLPMLWLSQQPDRAQLRCLLLRLDRVMEAGGEQCKVMSKVLNGCTDLLFMPGDPPSRIRVLPRHGWRLGQPLNEKVYLAKRRYSLRQALDAIIEQTPGGFWSTSKEGPRSVMILIGTAPRRDAFEGQLVMAALSYSEALSYWDKRPWEQLGLAKYAEEYLIMTEGVDLMQLIRDYPTATDRLIYVACMKRNGEGAKSLSGILKTCSVEIADTAARYIEYANAGPGLPEAYAEVLEQLIAYRPVDEIQKKLQEMLKAACGTDAAPDVKELLDARGNGFDDLIDRIYKIRNETKDEQIRDEANHIAGALRVMRTARYTKNGLPWQRIRYLATVPTKESVREIFQIVAAKPDLKTTALDSLEKIAKVALRDERREILGDKRISVNWVETEAAAMAKLVEAGGWELDFSPEGKKLFLGESKTYYSGTDWRAKSLLRPTMILKGNKLILVSEDEALEHFREVFKDWLN